MKAADVKIGATGWEVKKTRRGKHSAGDDGGRAPVLGEKAPSFVIVLWLEDGEIQGEPEWRWRVTHVQTEEQAYFRRLADILAYVSAKAGVSPPC